MDKDSRAVAGDLKKIYQSATVGEAEAELEKFAEVWGVKYPTIVKQWRRKWTALIALFEFPPAIRKAIYTTHAIESVNSVIRKFTRNRKQYPNAESALKLVYLAIHEAARRWTMPIVGWKAARNPFAIVFEDRLPHCSKNGPPNPIPTQLTQKNLQAHTGVALFLPFLPPMYADSPPLCPKKGQANRKLVRGGCPVGAAAVPKNPMPWLSPAPWIGSDGH
jgi:hypothetical protein